MNSRLSELAADRRFCLFLFGAHAKEIGVGFVAMKNKLTLAGAKLSKVPAQYEQQALFLSRLKGKQREVVCAWFRENCKFDDLVGLGETLEAQQSLEDVAMLPKEESSRFWRVVLREYIQVAPNPLVEEFLGGGIVPDARPLLPPMELPVPISLGDAEAIMAAARGELGAASPGQPFLEFILGVVGILRADPKLLEKGRGYLLNRGPATDQGLLAVLDVLAATKGEGGAVRRGLVTRPASKLSTVVVGDPAEYAVLGCRTHVTHAGASFVKISGLLDAGTLVDLPPGDAEHLYPATGDAIAHPRGIPGYPNDYAGFSMWRVEHGRSDLPTQFVVSKWLHSVYEIVQVPHSSTEPNQVREWLLESYRPDPAVYPLFHMEDGVLVKFATGTRDPRQVDFDVPLQGYYAIEAVEWRARKLVVTPLPAPQFKYDCSPPATLVKRLFKHRAKVDGMPTITRAQIDELVGLLAGEGGIDAATTRQRDLSDLEALLGSKAAMEAAIEGVLQLPVIQAAIAEEKARAVDAARFQRESEQAAIDALRAVKQGIEEEIRRVKEDQKKQARELGAEVKKAFERASIDASKTLAEVALFKALLGKTGDNEVSERLQPAAKIEATKPVATQVTLLGKQLASVKDVNVSIARHCIASGLGQRFIQSMLAAAATQSVVALVGSRYRQVSMVLTSLIGGGVGCQVAVTADMFGSHDLMNTPAIVTGSVVQGILLGDFISAQQAAGYPTVVRLTGANRAPMESYVPELLSAAASHGTGGALSWTGKDGEPRLARICAPLVFVLDFVGGKSTFPMVAPLACEVPVFDTDSTWFDSDVADHESVPPHSHVAPAFWDSLRSAVDVIPAAVASVLGHVGSEAASRMASACRGLDMDRDEAVALGLAAFGIGRVDGQAALQALPALDRPLAADLGRYLPGTGAGTLGRIFDMDEGMAQ